MSDLGDISKFIEGSVPNLDWLKVDERAYQALDRLPKQNLDILPDLEEAWSHGDAPLHGNLEPNTGESLTMLDVGRRGPKMATVKEIARVAVKALNESSSVPAMVKLLASAFDQTSLQAAHPVLKQVVASFRQHQKQAATKAPGEFSGQRQTVAKKEASSKEQVQQGLEAVSKTATDESKKQQWKVAAEKAAPVVALLRREMLKGRSASDILKALKMSFDVRDLQATREHWEPLFRKVGLYGVVYSSQDSFPTCPEGADFLAKHASSVKGIVAGDKCGSCIFSQVGRCMMYGRRLVAKEGDLITAEMVQALLDEHKLSGRLPHDFQPTGETLEENLKAIHEAAMSPKPSAALNLRSTVERAFTGATRQHKTSPMTVREVVKTACQYMNEGLYGRELLAVLKSRFEERDIQASVPELKQVLAEQGLQGYKFVDPTVYDDYGKGCKVAARKFRTKTAVQYLKVGSKCNSCVHQTSPGFCSVIHKQLVVEPPYVDKAAEQKAILSSGSAIDVPLGNLVNSGLSMLQEYQLQQSGDVDLNPEAPSVEVSVELGTSEVKL